MNKHVNNYTLIWFEFES